ncbi:type II toxin-antitoxin system RelE/ParE family toxin [Phormidium sp. FACHB-1136]|uniref:type II toxin-antitoxin system RelE family toxin n=1 Tax=Phormidium sp. FACHB-1136 TaxID=2692848 RepID=UPI001682B378|nr:type II toxin-antitoxin system RelE/ParE family toxin [Phormidium sp. FACHB-1136]MBD2425046.1 type II toxin-antitoxin system RelE/ParE family toxin [Phormidium sp. FACHB-1136]
MPYSVFIAKSVQKQINRLPTTIKAKVIEKIVLLKSEPRPVGVVKLKGYDFQYRLRVGNYRIRYEIFDADLRIEILQCKHRREIYKDNS